MRRMRSFGAAAGVEGAKHVRRRRVRLFAAVLAGITLATSLLHADDPRPKLGPDAVPIQQSHEYLRSHEAPDYWALSPYYVPQATDSACSLATVAMLLNALRGLPPRAADELVTQKALLAAAGSERWTQETSEAGPGVTWQEFADDVRLGLKAYGVDAEIEIFRPPDDSDETRDAMRRVLAENERSDRDIVLIYFNQGVLTGDWDGPHISPIGAYDAEHHRVLVMDVDRQWYVPYWSGDEKLLEAMRRPAPARFGALAGETGGLIRVVKKAAPP